MTSEDFSLNVSHFLKKLFLGSYQFVRCIKPGPILCEGTAFWEEISPEKRAYEEKGVYGDFFPLQEFYQKRIFEIGEKRCAIFKKDGVVLHEFHWEKENLNLPFLFTHVHTCKKDLYSLEFRGEGLESFSLFYWVKGPCKNYTIETKFYRDRKRIF